MNKTTIDWPGLTHTLNPVVGCKTGCYYCYAKKMNTRFKWIDDWTKPVFFPERLNDPDLQKKGPYKIFIGSMCDLFGGWISSEWILEVIEITYHHDQHEFMFLTKHPNRYNEFEFPSNVWLGTTIEQFDDKRMERLYDMDSINTLAKKFISIEPLLGDFYALKLSHFDLIIIGAMTGPGAIKPEKDWIESIKNDNVHYKNNLSWK